MVTRTVGFALSLALMPVLGCASNAQARQCPTSPEGEGVESTSAEEPATTASPQTRNAPETTSPSSLEPEPGATSPSVETSELAQVHDAESLPELKIEITGMHIGGGPNDNETKRPFLTAIETGFDQLRQCYQKAEEPSKGGSYGVDLRVEREGGHPTVQSVRTAMKGDAMKVCLEEAFRGLSFDKPARGATVFSVSLRFTLGR